MKNSQSRSFLLIGGVVVLLFFALVITDFIKRSSSSEVVAVETVAPSDWRGNQQYVDKSVGFSLALPGAWQEIGYKISSSTNDTGVVTYSLSLSYKDENGVHDGFGQTEIIAVPSGADATQYKMGGPFNDIEVGVEIGKNSRYTFVSRQFSPEAWGSCQNDDKFKTQNERLCTEGSSLRNPERQEGAFKVLE